MTASQSFRITFFPDDTALSGNPYWMILKKGLEATGAQYVIPDVSLLRWLWQTRHQPTVLHIHYVQQFYAYENDTARLRWVVRLARNLRLARLWGHHVIFTLHNLTPTYPLRPAWVDLLGHRLVVGLADEVIVHCETARDLLAETYGRHSGVQVVPHPHFIGVYPDTVTRDEARRYFGYQQDDVVLGFVGGVRPNKGVDRLVRVFRQCDDPRLRLLIAGAPGLPDEYIAAIRTAVAKDSRIRLCLARIPDQELQYYYRAADAIVLPFARILTSGSVMLAMSFGRAVVVPRLGCVGEIPKNVAVMYSSENDEGLLETLRTIGQIDLAKMGRIALTYAEGFPPSEFVKKTLAAYQLNPKY